MTNVSPPFDSWDLWYGRAQRAIWLSLGTGGLVHQFLLASTAQPILVAAAIGCLGLPLTKALDKKVNE